MNERALAWLAARAADVPPALQTRMEEAVRNTAGALPADAHDGLDHEGELHDHDARHVHDDIGALSGTLAAAALDCLRAALHDCDDRSAALHLLAADGLVTHACAAAADAPAALGALGAALDTARLEELAAAYGPP